MTNGNGTHFNHFIAQLDKRLERIEIAIDRLADEVEGKHERLNGRVGELERVKAEVAGGWKLASVVGAVAGTLGGVVSKWFPFG